MQLRAFAVCASTNDRTICSLLVVLLRPLCATPIAKVKWVCNGTFVHKHKKRTFVQQGKAVSAIW